MKRLSLAVLVTAALVATAAACTSRDVARYNCLDNGRTVYDVPSDHVSPWPSSLLVLPNGSAIDASGEVFDDTVPTASGYYLGVKFHYKPDQRVGLCMVGGTVTSSMDPENNTWETWHHSYGMTIEVDDFTVVGATLRNQGDGISFSGADNWAVIGVRADGGGVLPGAYIHDDCIQNDGMFNGSVDDSKFDGCNTFMSSYSTVSGANNTVTVKDTLVRLQPYWNSFNTAKYGFNQTGGFFKWSNPALVGGGTPPHLVIRNSVFRADKQALYSGNSNGFLGLPPGTDCDGVMLVGTAAWRATDIASWTSQCTNLTFGTMADWNQRVADWDAAHPQS